MYQLPSPPLTGIVVDGRGITWRRNAEGLYDPDACPTCQSHLPGGLTWAALLEQRGPINDPT